MGLTEKSLNQFEKIDPEKISGYLIEMFNPEIQWNQGVFKVKGKNFGIFYIYECVQKPVIAKKDGGKDQIIKNGDIYYRYAGRTQKILFAELQNIMQKRLDIQDESWKNLMSRIAEVGPSNVATLDVEKGGTKDVLKIEGKKLTELYPLSAMELAIEVKKQIPSAPTKRIWEIIKENSLKNDATYSAYNFRNWSQEKEYKDSGRVASGIPSIYNQQAIDFIIKILTQESL